MIPPASTGLVTRDPEYPDHRRIVAHDLAFSLEPGINRGRDEHVVDDLAELPIIAAHADTPIGATLSGDEVALDPFALNCWIASKLSARLVVLHVRELPDGDRLAKCLARLRTLGP